MIKIPSKITVTIYILSILFGIFYFAGYSFCQSYVDVSGKWTVNFVGIEKGCAESSKNGNNKGVFQFDVSQQGKSVAGLSDNGRTTNILSGMLTGKSIKLTVKGVTDDCQSETRLRGQVISQNIIKGSYEGANINCDTCNWHGMFSVEINKK